MSTKNRNKIAKERTRQMNKKEISEIKKLCKAENLAGTLCACYYDTKNDGPVMTIKKKIFNMSEEDISLYSDILKNIMTGKAGKQLHNLKFPLKAEKDGGQQVFLYSVLKNMDDDELTSEFISRLMEYSRLEGKYLVLLYKDIYDIPGKYDEESEESEYVYEYLQCAICPIILPKPALIIDKVKNTITDSPKSWTVGKPIHGFLFPAFNDRATDVHSTLYFRKKDICEGIIEDFLGCKTIVPIESQHSFFETEFPKLYDGQCSYSSACAFFDKLEEYASDTGDSTISWDSLSKILSCMEIPQDKIDSFKQEYENLMGNNEIFLSSMYPVDKVEVEVGNTKIKLDTLDRSDLEFKIINNRTKIVLPVTGAIFINDVPVIPK